VPAERSAPLGSAPGPQGTARRPWPGPHGGGRAVRLHRISRKATDAGGPYRHGHRPREGAVVTLPEDRAHLPGPATRTRPAMRRGVLAPIPPSRSCSWAPITWPAAGRDRTTGIPFRPCSTAAFRCPGERVPSGTRGVVPRETRW